jgi:hypothetical protein
VKAKPQKLLVIADGPRTGHSEDVDKCKAARAIVERVDWECEILKNYSDVNLGCGQRPATGISWVFKNVDEAIILEDDCVPHPTFFQFCEELLDFYRNDERVMMIAGRSNLYDLKRPSYSYYFSRIPACWGWATWRRAWHYFDIKIKLWQELRTTSLLSDILFDNCEVTYWNDIFNKAYRASGDADYWDYQWLFACWAQNGLTITPNKNLVHNIGFGEQATHTTSLKDKRAGILAEEMIFPLKHPSYMIRDIEADKQRSTYFMPKGHDHSKCNHKGRLWGWLQMNRFNTILDRYRRKLSIF